MKLLLFGFLFFSIPTFAQVNGSTSSNGSLFTDTMGRVLKPSNKTFIDGSPYLSNNWSSGTVSSNGNKIFTFKEMKYNLLSNQIEHEVNGQLYAISDEIKEFEITVKNENGQIINKKFRKNFPSIKDFTDKTFYEILYDGNVKFLKKISIRVSSHSKPLSNQIEKSFYQTINYFYLNSSGEIIPFQKGKNEVLAVINDKKEELSALIKKENLSMKIEEDIIILIMKYDQNIKN